MDKEQMKEELRVAFSSQKLLIFGFLYLVILAILAVCFYYGKGKG